MRIDSDKRDLDVPMERQPSVGFPHVPVTSQDTAHHYGEEYYSTYAGIGYVRCATWLNLFAALAEKLIAHLEPTSSLDAGCAKGFLVESLRDRGVDAWGVDLSPYAIAGVRDDIKPYCRVGSLTDSLGGPYDLVTCIEVIEHIPGSEEVLVFQRLTEATDAIFFSSTPEHDDDPSHYNVRPMRYWLERFAAHGFYPDPSFDPNFAYQAYLLRRRKPDEAAYLEAYSSLLDMRQRHAKLTELSRLSSQDVRLFEALRSHFGEDPSARAAELLAQNLATQQRLTEIENSMGWKILSGYRAWLQNTLRSRPFMARMIEPIASRIARWMSRGGCSPS